MIRRTVIFFGSGLALLFILFPSGINNSTNPRNVNFKPQTEPFMSSANNRSNSDSLTPAVSGVAGVFPWDNDPEFINAKQQNNNPVLIAGYCTVLRDPLPGEENNVHLGARMLAGTIIKPGHIFSQNQAIGPYNQRRGFGIGPVYIANRLSTNVGGGVCKIASTLYNVAILSDLRIIERHAHSMPVPYVPYGQDATVAYGVRDFKFQNSTPFPIMIWAQGVENRLYIAFYGMEKAPEVKWHHEVQKTIKTYKTYRTNSSLAENMERVIVPGMDGAIIKSWVTVTYPDGTTKIRNLGKSYYNCMPYLIEKGTATPTP